MLLHEIKKSLLPRLVHFNWMHFSDGPTTCRLRMHSLFIELAQHKTRTSPIIRRTVAAVAAAR